MRQTLLFQLPIHLLVGYPCCKFEEVLTTTMAFNCAIPAIPSIQLDDETVRITRWDFAPGATTGHHRHGYAYFVVMLTDGTLRVDDNLSVTETVLLAGQSYRRPAGIEHDVMNGGDQSMAFVEIEIKKSLD